MNKQVDALMPLSSFFVSFFNVTAARTMMINAPFLVCLVLLKGATAFNPVAVPAVKKSLTLFMTRPRVASPSVTNTERSALLELFNSQVTREMEASQLYLAASIWMDDREMVGMASFMRSESSEERGHALEMIDFASKRDIPIQLEEIDAPECDWETPEDVWMDVLDSERENTQRLLNLADAAQACHDHAVTTFLMPFHMEQVDSEDKLKTIVAKVTDENKTPGLLRQLDSELGLEASSHA